MRRFHVADARETLRRERHRLEDRRIDRAERDVIGRERERALEFRVVVRADAEPQACLADRAHVGAVEIALAEMDPGRALVDRDAPVIVDDQRRACVAQIASASRVSRATCVSSCP